MAVRIELDLPSPPTINHAYGRGAEGGKLYRASHYKAWIKTAGLEIMVQRPKMEVKGIGSGRYGIRIRWPEGDEADIDNRIKALLDFLVLMRVTPDDRFARHLSVGYSPDAQAGRCLVRVWPMG